MGCGILYRQLNSIDNALMDLALRGILPSNPAYQAIYKLRGETLGRLGAKFPRTILQLVKIVGLSPGELRAWFDVEGGWMVEARARPGALPVYHYVDADTAARVIKGDIDHEVEERMLTPTEPVMH